MYTYFFQQRQLKSVTTHEQKLLSCLSYFISYNKIQILIFQTSLGLYKHAKEKGEEHYSFIFKNSFWGNKHHNPFLKYIGKKTNTCACIAPVAYSSHKIDTRRMQKEKMVIYPAAPARIDTALGILKVAGHLLVNYNLFYWLSKLVLRGSLFNFHLILKPSKWLSLVSPSTFTKSWEMIFISIVQFELKICAQLILTTMWATRGTR